MPHLSARTVTRGVGPLRSPITGRWRRNRRRRSTSRPEVADEAQVVDEHRVAANRYLEDDFKLQAIRLRPPTGPRRIRRPQFAVRRRFTFFGKSGGDPEGDVL